MDNQYKGAKTDTKMLPFSELMQNKKLYWVVCAAIALIALMTVTALGRVFTNIPELIRGTFPKYLLLIPSLRFMPGYIVALLAAGLFSVMLAYKLHVNFRNLNIGHKGHAATLTREDIEARFLCIPEKNSSFPGMGGMPVARKGNKLFIETQMVNNFILAISRAGKTEILIIPTIDILSRAKIKTSMIILDVKGEISRATVPMLLDRSYEVVIYDFLDFMHTNFFNPFNAVVEAFKAGRFDDAEELSAAFAYTQVKEANTDRLWVDAPRSLLVALILALCEDCIESGMEEKVSPYSAFVLMNVLNSKTKSGANDKPLDNFFNSRPPTNSARLAYSTVSVAEGKTRSSILGILISAMDIYRRPNVAKMTSKNDFRLEDIGFGEKPVAVFLRMPFHTRTYDAVVSTFLSQAFYLNMDMAAKTNNGKCKRPVRVEADEMFNIPAIDAMDNKISVGLGANWAWDLVAQSMAQVENVYGKDVGKIIMDNCATVYFISSPSKENREFISEMAGNETIINATRTGTALGLEKQFTETFEKEEVLPAQELTELTEGEMFVFPTLHRRDLQGNPVIPKPILNKGENAMKFRYQYLPELDPDEPIPYGRLKIDAGAMKSINLEELVYLPGKDDYVPNNKSNQTVESVLKPTIIQFISGILPEDYELDFGKMTIADFTAELLKMVEDGDLREVDYKSIVGYLEKT